MGTKGSHYIFQNRDDKYMAEIQVICISAIKVRRELKFALDASCGTYQARSSWNAQPGFCAINYLLREWL